jgi:broad specificity phosphatase PhoE
MGNIERGRMPEEEKPKLSVDIFRHGETEYKQKEVPSEEANDLTEKGIADVRRNAEALAELIAPDEEVEIWSSPMGRTQHTARIIQEVLRDRGVKFHARKGHEPKVKVFEALTEVKNFSWNLFEPLINGGEMEFAGKKFFIDKNKSNPLGKVYPDYFTDGAIKDIPDEAMAEWPEEYARTIKGFETFVEVTRRLMRNMERIKKLQDKPYRIIFATHDGMMGFVANLFTKGKARGVDRGEFINLERVGGKLVATQVGQHKEGDSETDVVDAFNKSHQDKA